ncbi:polyprenyl synthetase family protein [Streptomyces sp. TRM 70351]|uniref:polyprenyl synthetase family protein n=1 Tax=Streptomyces sp. TRM 70351 TaxID=3116552 RepID=UPI002E7C11A5|nr:polyprenyl synthetase family protein [Streptomyces sp. TRM 70351]MEE1927129.1 polyprenyl synthetase family protein [Streptomyces sp. TRM 70351]
MRHQATDLAIAPHTPPPGAAPPGAVPARPGTAPGRDGPEEDGRAAPPGADADVAAAVDAVLGGHLARRLEQAEQISERFAADVADCVVTLVRRGGKRLRPAFLWWGWRAAGGAPEGAGAGAVLRAAAALELIQACALVHDDLMDGSPLRRGAPAAHVALAHRHRAARLHGDAEAFGASAALLAGDLALVWAEDLWDAALPTEAARRRTRPVWRAMRTEMVAGQYLDLHGQAARARSRDAALHVAHLKSGLYTVERPLHLGAALADAPAATTAALRRAGRRTGVAFQLRDDLLGVFGDPARTGKPAGEDVRAGKPTYLMAVGLARARARGERAAEERLTAALGDRALGAAGLDRVRELLTGLGAREAVERHIAELTGSALAALDEADLDPGAARRLAALVRGVLAGSEPAGRGTAHAPGVAGATDTARAAAGPV